MADSSVPADAVTNKPDPSVEPLLGTIASAVAQASPTPTHFVHPPAFLGQLPGTGGNQMLAFDTALGLDTDRWSGDRGNADWQAETSLRYADGSSLNANQVPYFVLPLPRAWPVHFGLALGDYAAVLFQERVTFRVFGD